MLAFRALSEMLSRAAIAMAAGKTFGGKRNVSEALGYTVTISEKDYRERFRRGGIAGRVVDAYPTATWRGTGELIEDETTSDQTPFEEAWTELSTRLNIWPMFRRADILAGLGRYAIVLIGAPGKMDTPLPDTLSAEQLFYLTPYAEDDVSIKRWAENEEDPRFGMPLEYEISRIGPAGVKGALSTARTVHFSRVVHVADGLLDDHVYGTPRLERVWNDFDDLVKVKGGGSEAFWQQVKGVMQLDIDPKMTLTPDAKEKLHEQWDEIEHGMRRTLTTKGVTVNDLSSGVSNFGPQVDTLIALISGATGIPQRILLGSERGELASTQDRENWADRVRDRRREFAEPFVVRPFVDMLISRGALPVPEEYVVRWPDVFDLPVGEQLDLAMKAAAINSSNGSVVITEDEIRDRFLGWEPREVEEEDAAPQVEIEEVPGPLLIGEGQTADRAATRRFAMRKRA